MTILDAQSKDTRRARCAIMGLLSRGAHIRALHGPDGRGWRDFHLVINGQRREANQSTLRGLAGSGKVTIRDNHEEGFTDFHGADLVLKGRIYANESR